MSDPGELEAFEADYDESDSAGCYECQGGWKHGCCDDMCRNCYEPDECDDAVPCRTCNPKGECNG